MLIKNTERTFLCLLRAQSGQKILLKSTERTENSTLITTIQRRENCMLKSIELKNK